MQSIIMELDKIEIEIQNKTIPRETQDLHGSAVGLRPQVFARRKWFDDQRFQATLCIFKC